MCALHIAPAARVTTPGDAPTARATPVPAAGGACAAPTPTTSWPPGCTTPSAPPRPPATASPAPPARPAPDPAKKRASDHDHRPPEHPRPHPRHPGRAGTPRLLRSDDLHADRAIGLIGDLACIYEGTQDHPATADPITVPPSLPAYAGPSSHDAVALSRADASTVVAALDIAADYKRDRAEMCADCPDQSCPTCETRLRDARAYDEMAGRLAWAAEAARTSRPEPDRQSQPAADREAGQ